MKASRATLFVSCLVLLSLAVCYGAIRSIVASKSVAVAMTTQEIAQKSAEAENLAAIRNAVNAFASQEATIDAYFVSEADVVAFINDLQARGQALGASVEIASVATANTPPKAHPALTMNVSVTGPFDVVMRTVGSIEYAPYDLSITSLSLTQTDPKTWQATASLLVGSTASSTQS